jgi:hypothetical protein
VWLLLLAHGLSDDGERGILMHGDAFDGLESFLCVRRTLFSVLASAAVDSWLILCGVVLKSEIMRQDQLAADMLMVMLRSVLIFEVHQSSEARNRSDKRVR